MMLLMFSLEIIQFSVTFFIVFQTDFPIVHSHAQKLLAIFQDVVMFPLNASEPVLGFSY